MKRMILAAVVVTAACSAPAGPTRPLTPLAGTFESPEALAQAVLTALERRDLEGLRALPLSEGEYREHVWPELPISRPERNVPFEYSWGQMKQRSDGSLRQTFARYAGTHLELVRTGFTGDTTKYASFTVMRDSEVIARDEAGRERILHLYGSVLIKNGRCKLFTYVVDS